MSSIDNKRKDKKEKSTTKSEVITIRLDPYTKAKLEYISNKEYRPLSLQIRKIIEDFIREYEKTHNLNDDPEYPVEIPF